jgi:sterol desaturase/sphingolipid hydroxylase (fatty acid hydroxylase superfamily)
MLEHADPSFLAQSLTAGFVALVRLVLGPTSRTFWPYLIVSLVVAVVIWRGERRRGVDLPPHLNVFSRETWLGRSAMNDYWLVLVNALLFGAIVSALLPDAARIAASIASALGDAHSGVPLPSMPWLPLLLAAALFVADDFARFAAHWLEHRVPALWALHKVHHSAEVMNFVTAERHHPLSLVFVGFVILSTIGVVNGLFLTVFRSELSTATVLGANVFWLAGNLLASSLRHSPVWLSFGPRVERWLLSPAQHQIHHSDNPAHFGTNLGSTLAIWDRMMGTLFVTSTRRLPLTFGLGDESAAYRSLPALYLRPLGQLVVGLAGRRRV